MLLYSFLPQLWQKTRWAPLPIDSEVPKARPVFADRFFRHDFTTFLPALQCAAPILVQHFLPPLRFLFSLHGFSVQFSRNPVIIYNFNLFFTTLKQVSSCFFRGDTIE